MFCILTAVLQLSVLVHYDRSTFFYIEFLTEHFWGFLNNKMLFAFGKVHFLIKITNSKISQSEKKINSSRKMNVSFPPSSSLSAIKLLSYI